METKARPPPPLTDIHSDSQRTAVPGGSALRSAPPPTRHGCVRGWTEQRHLRACLRFPTNEAVWGDFTAFREGKLERTAGPGGKQAFSLVIPKLLKCDRINCAQAVKKAVYVRFEALVTVATEGDIYLSASRLLGNFSAPNVGWLAGWLAGPLLIYRAAKTSLGLAEAPRGRATSCPSAISK